MKKFFYCLMAATAAIAACKKVDMPNTSENTEAKMIQRTFNATSIQTRTSMGEGMSVNWSDGDEIKVIAVLDGNQESYIFKLQSGSGKPNAVFSGEIAEEYADAEFYAIYPPLYSASVSGSGESASLSITDYNSTHDVRAVEGSFDSSRALLFAKANGDSVSFYHGVSYFKIKIGYEGVKSVTFTCSGGGRIWGNPQYSFNPKQIESGAINNGSSDRNYVTLTKGDEGYLTKDAIYYVPVTVKTESKFGTLELQYTYDDVIVKKSTNVLTSEYMNLGYIFDLGNPPMVLTPAITSSNISINSSDEEGSIVYSISNPVDGGLISAQISEDKTTIADFKLGEPHDDSISFTCSANNDEETKYAYVTLSYPGAESIEVIVSQRAIGEVEDDQPKWTWVANNNANASYTITGNELSITSNGKYESSQQTFAALYQEFTGDFTATVQLVSYNPTNANSNQAIAGIIVIDGDAEVTGNNLVFGVGGKYFAYRIESGTTKGSATPTPPDGSGDMILKMVRAKNKVTVSYSLDGGQSFGGESLKEFTSLSDTIKLGVAANSGHNTTPSTAVFRNFIVNDKLINFTPAVD